MQLEYLVGVSIHMMSQGLVGKSNITQSRHKLGGQTVECGQIFMLGSYITAKHCSQCS